jgi:tRNA (cmo5U34)-methyltransferase
MLMPKDNIYSNKRTVTPFKFDEEVVQVFPDMIGRSVPGYDLTLPMIGLIAGRYVRPNSNIYDLGCSLGAASIIMRHHINHEGCRIIGVDNSEAMVNQCRKNVANDTASVPMDVILGDIRTAEIKNASMVVLNFTLQFIEPADRDALVQRIYAGLNPGGVLVVSEKVVFDTAEKTTRFIDLHHDFKRANGYSDLEVAQKRTSIMNVLIPETIPAHQKRMLDAGFNSADLWFQALNFCSLLAIK